MAASPAPGEGAAPDAFDLDAEVSDPFSGGEVGHLDLAAVELVRVRMPLRQPHRTASSTEAARDLVLVRAIGGDTVEGWGECSTLTRPTYTGEYTVAAWHLLRREVVPALLAGQPTALRGHPMALAGVRSALLDLRLRREGTSLAAHLGGARAAVPSCAVISVTGSDEVLLEAVAAAVERGHRHVKLKVEPGWLRQPLGLVRGRWPELGLAADGNGSLGGVDEAELAQLDDLGLSYLEQPFGPDELVATAALARGLATPLALDESIGSVGAARTALALDAAQVINVKPARVGGVVEAVRIGRLAAEGGVPAFVGGMLETGVGRAAALAVASVSAFDLPSDLGPTAQYFADDLVPPFRLVDGALAVPSGPGIGVVPERGRVQGFATERLVIWP